MVEVHSSDTAHYQPASTAKGVTVLRCVYLNNKMFGMLNSLDSSKWRNSDSPPGNKAEAAGGAYEEFAVMDATQNKDHVKYVLIPDDGDPCKGLLYGNKSDPLRGVSSCWFAFGKGNIIKGIILEEDWVVITDDYLAELEANVKDTNEPPDMGLFYDLNKDKWQRKGDPPGSKAKLGYVEYNITQVDVVSETELEVQVAKTSNGDSSSVKVINVVYNCFRSTPTCFLKLNKGLVVGIITKDDWIIQKK